MNLLEEFINISIGAAALMRDRIIKELAVLCEEFPEEEKAEFRAKLLERAEEEKERLKDWVSARMEARLLELGFVHKERIEELEERLRELEEKIARQK